MFFNLLEAIIIEDKTQFEDKTVYFYNKSWCTKIPSTTSSWVDALVSDHKEAEQSW